ncbi:MAG: FAD-dependent oxidoreductase, partial [Thermoguttaceae bacterium]
ASTGLSAAAAVAAGPSVAAAAAPQAGRDAADLTADVLVCGGGPAGMAAAVMAARGGAKVLLVERYGRLGGMGVHGRVAPLMGHSKSPFVDEILERIGGVKIDPDRLDLQYAELVEEAGADLLLHAWACDTQLEGRRVVGTRLLTKQGMLNVRASVIVDATGDGDVALGAGAAFELGRPGDGLLQPMSIMYTVAGLDEARAIYCGSEDQARQLLVDGQSWESIVGRARQAAELPENVGVVRTYKTSRPGEAVVNATQINYVDGTRVRDLTRAELEGRRQALKILDFLRKYGPGYENAYVAGMPAVIGVRETRRILGLEYLTRDDLLAGRRRDDAVVRSASFVIDIHNPAGAGQAEGLAAQVKPYDIPYGCLVPRQVDGLLVAGRCISGSHEAHASYRVQQIAMAIGSAAGAAAAIAAGSGVAPREVVATQVQSALKLPS